MLVLFLLGCNQSSTLSPKQFAQDYAAALKKSAPDLDVKIVHNLELRTIDKANQTNTCFLDNAYNGYKQDPARKEEVIRKYVTALLETIREKTAPIDPARIVPVIKDKAYLDEIKQSLKGRGFASDKLLFVYEEYNPELLIFYAEDSPKNIRYLTTDKLTELKLTLSDLRSLAVKNLASLLPRPEIRGTNGVFIVTAGGDYDASLILLGSVWTRKELKVDGKLVLAVPSRDLLLVTGSSNKTGLAVLKKTAAKTVAEAPYRLTPRLFIYESDRFQLFEQ